MHKDYQHKLWISVLLTTAVLSVLDEKPIVFLDDDSSRADNSTIFVLENETLIIACTSNQSNPRLVFQSEEADEIVYISNSPRIVQSSGNGWINTTITALEAADSGVYTCEGNSREIQVINSSDAVYSTTPRYRIMETGSTLRSTENKALIFVKGASFYRPSPHARNPVHKAPHYLGYVASLGSNITILCNAKDGLLPGSSELRFQAWEAVSKRQTYLLRSLAKSDDRVSLVEGDSWHNASITNVSYSDSGLYLCNSDWKRILVLNPDKIPQITGYTCMAENFESMQCTFYTNLVDDDLISWDASYATSSPQKCILERPCENIECEGMTRVLDQSGLQTIKCGINFMFYKETYLLSVSAMNPLHYAQFSLNTTLDFSILKLGQPLSVEANSSGPHSIRLHVTRPDVGSVFKSDINQTYIRYRVLDSDNNINMIFVSNSRINVFDVTNLLPYTRHNLEIRCQINNTQNSHIWSDNVIVTATTFEEVPSVAPGQYHDMFSFNDHRTSSCTEDKRSVTLYWNGVPSTTGHGNGIITSYSIYKLSAADMIETGHSQTLDSGQLMEQVDSNKRSTRLCVSLDAQLLAIVASNSAGIGIKFGAYRIPSIDRVTTLRDCELSAFVQPSSSLMMSWPRVRGGERHNYTLYLCHHDECKTEKLTFGSDMKDRENYVNDYATTSLIKLGMEEAVTSSSLRLGLSISSDRGSSGIHWVRCVGNLTSGFKEVELDITMRGLEAEVSIVSTCEYNIDSHKQSDYYILKYCQFNTKTKSCISDVGELYMTPCNLTATVPLHKYSTEFVFWVTSALSSNVTSLPFQLETVGQGLLHYQLGLIIAVCLVTVMIPISLISIRCYKQSWNARKMAKPKLVLPEVDLELMSQYESADESDSDEDDMDDREMSNEITHPYHMAYHITRGLEAYQMQVPLDNSEYKDYDDPEVHLIDTSNQSSAPPIMLTSFHSTYCPAALSVESLNFSELPDEYFEQFHSGCEPPSSPSEEPGESLSVQMFFVPESDEDDDQLLVQLGDFLHTNDNNYVQRHNDDYTKLPSSRSSVTSNVCAPSTEPCIDTQQHDSANAYSSLPDTATLIHTPRRDSVDYNNHQSDDSDTDDDTPRSAHPRFKIYEENSSGDSGYISPADIIRAHAMASVSMEECEL